MFVSNCWRGLAILLAVLAGCDSPVAKSPVAAPPRAAIGSQFDPFGVGSISGRVSWDGPIPTLPPVSAVVFLPTGVEHRNYPHPNAPDIDPKSRGVRGAVVYLDGVDASRSRPWDLAPVRVEIHDDRIAVVQGDAEPGSVGFVRRGDEIEMVSSDSAVHVLSARGAAFFGLAFPDPERPL